MFRLLFLTNGMLFLAANALASSLSWENTNEPTNWSSELLLTKDITRGHNDSLKDFTFSFTDSMVLPDQNATLGSWIQTTAVTFGLDWEFGIRKQWNTTLDINFSNQPQEKYSTSGLEYDVTRKFEFGESLKSSEHAPSDSDADKDEVFTPSVEVGIKLGYTSLNQRAKTRIGRILLNDIVEPQTKTGINIRLNFAEWGSLSSEYNGYGYSPSISALLSNLNTTRFARAFQASAQGQLNNFDWTNKLIFYLGDNWEWNLSEETTQALSGGGMAYLYETTLDYKLSKTFDVELGVGQVLPANDIESVLNLTYAF